MTVYLASPEHGVSMSVSSKSTQKIREAIDTLCSAADTLDNLAMSHPPDKPAHPIAAQRFDRLPEQHSEDETLLKTAADPIRLVLEGDAVESIAEALTRIADALSGKAASMGKDGVDAQPAG